MNESGSLLLLLLKVFLRNAFFFHVVYGALQRGEKQTIRLIKNLLVGGKSQREIISLPIVAFAVVVVVLVLDVVDVVDVDVVDVVRQEFIFKLVLLSLCVVFEL